MPRPNKARSIGDEANLAERIALEREKRGLSYPGLAKLMTDAGCAIQPSAIYKIEKANRRITVDELVAVARVFEVPIDEMMTPIGLLAQERAVELLEQMDKGEGLFVDSIGQLLAIYTEFLTVAKDAPELLEYVFGQRFSDGYARNAYTLEVPGFPDYDFGPLREACRDLHGRILQESARMADLLDPHIAGRVMALIGAHDQQPANPTTSQETSCP